MEQLSCFLLFLAYLIGYSSSDVTNLGEGYNWKQAMEACENKGGSLPEVTIIGTGFGQINDIQHKDVCIWLKATYTRADNMTDDKYPNSCCEIIFRDENGIDKKDCVLCSGHNRYMCASGNSTISWQYSRDVDEAPWLSAAQNCSNHGLGLPSDTNTEFLKYLLPGQVMWVNGVRTLNTNPTKGDGMFPVCSCNGLVQRTCPSILWTFCVLETGDKEISRLNIDTINISSTTVTNVNYSTNAPTLNDCSQASLNVPKTSTRTLEDTSLLHTAQTTQENSALIGCVAGASVILTMIIIIVVFFLLIRSKQTENKNSNSQSPLNNDHLFKAKIHMNDACDDVNGEVQNSDNHASTQIQHKEKESITYATPNKVQAFSEITRDNYSGIITNEEQSRTGVYSEVQKRPKTGQSLNTMNQNTVGDDEYDKINFVKSYQTQQAKHVGDVYDKTNLHCEHREEYFENVYNKAEFYHKRQNLDARNVYDKANFHDAQQDRCSEIAHTDEKSASPSQSSENVYAKVYFHRRPQDERSGYVCDKIKLQL